MANTEGLPDEFVESLMTTPSTGPAQQSKASKQRQRILERMDMPMPQGGPSAKVVRFSQRPQESSQVEEVDESTPVDSLPLPIVGEILERTPSAIPQRRQQGAGKKPSRFAMQQQSQSSSLNGFPSVNMPLGTFVKSKPMKPKPVVRPKVVAATPPPVVKSKPLHKEGITTESMLEASRRDASQMLEGMTVDEIRQEQKELSSALSPATIAFLKKRQKQNKPLQSHEDTIPSSSSSPEESLDALPHNNVPEKVTQVDKKKQIANLVSKVRTHEEMDQVYETVMNDTHPLSRDDSDEPQGNDFFMACDLLRSNNSRQALWASRVVLASLTERLKELISGKQEAKVKRDWPVVLPVSLRCLLDEPLSRSGGFLLHANVLQALHILLLLTAHPDHVHRAFPTSEPTAADVYQEFFMEDAVPTPRLEDIYKGASPQPIPMESTSKQDGSAAAYSTQSNSTSAQSDGESFDKDPMWTLLSKMKIVPRLAQLLNSGKNNHGTIAWPPEAWMAMIGILTMIAQRSPGAASAIAHHETILTVLVGRIASVIQESGDESPELVSEWKVVHCTLELMGTLARQSRVAAEALPIADVLPPLLATVASSEWVYQLQRLGIQLWRTLLRYGMGLEAIETMSVAAASHLAMSPLSKYSLSTDFCAAFAQVFECAFIMEESKGSTKVPHAAASILSNIQMYLGASVRQTFLLPSSSNTTKVDSQGGILQYRWSTARMRLLSNYWRLASVSTNTSEDSGESKSADEAWSMEQVLVCLEALDEWTDSGSLVEQACIHSGGFLKERRSLEPKDWAIEAAACAFIESYTSLLLTLSTSMKTQNNRMVQELCQSVFKHLLPYMLQDQLDVQDVDMQSPTAVSATPLARRGWATQCDIAVAKLLFRCIATGVAASSSDRHLIRTLVFGLLGRLEIGHEASAAILLSQDTLFKATGDPLSDADTAHFATSPISSMFLAELCGSEKSRQQLDHSFKLQHGFGITQAGCGAFELQSLLSGADLPGPASTSTDLSLPLGPFWLWQTLTGQIRTKVEQVTHATDEALQVVNAVLGLLLDVEEGMDIVEPAAMKHVPQVPLGVKLYYLMNVCLHNETILRDDRISELGQSLLDRFWPCITVRSVTEFARGCLQHTDPSKTEANDLDEKEKQFLKLLEPETSQECGLTSHEIRSVEAFLDDLVEAYTDYGAQYDFFTKCIRHFLLPMFPASLRVRTLRDLRGALHLLTLQAELEPTDETLHKLLTHSVSDHTATRDEPEILEAVTQVLMPGNLPRPAQGYVRAYAVAVLARNVFLCHITGEGLETMMHRLVRLDKATVESIFASASGVREEYTREELASATLQVIAFSETTLAVEFFTEEDLQNRIAQWKS